MFYSKGFSIYVKFCLIMVLLIKNVTCLNTDKQILIVSFDGFAKSYLNLIEMKNLSIFSLHGSHPIHFKSVFVTKTIPNHFSVATGVFEEVHGLIGNSVFDPVLNRTLKQTDSEVYKQNDEILPLWSINELNGGYSGCVMWPGCEVSFKQKAVTYYEPFNNSKSLHELFDLSLQWLTANESPANLIFMYYYQPDIVGHQFGPKSEHLLSELRKIDEGIGYLNAKLHLFSLHDKVDTIILSDHGMASIMEENIIYISSILNKDWFTHSGSTPVWNIWPKIGKELLVYKVLANASQHFNFKVYLKEDIPLKWHYKNNVRVSEITVVANEGYAFEDFWNTIKYVNKSDIQMNNIHGDHGYDPDLPSMEPIFFAVGPSFKENFTAPSFVNVDVYPLICQMLGVFPGPNNGSLQNISTIIKPPLKEMLMRPLIFIVGIAGVLIILVGILAVFLRKREKKTVSAERLINNIAYRKSLANSSVSNNEEEESLLENFEASFI